MKKTKLLVLSSLLFTLGVTGCNLGGETSTDDGYRTSKTEHWQEDKSGVIIGNKEKHTFEDYPGDKTHLPQKATCSEEGLSYQQCSVCGYVKTNTSPKLDHEMVADATKSKASTCSEAGVEATKCKNCDHTEEKALEKLAHSYGTVSVVHAAEDGVKSTAKKKTCGTCGEVDVFLDAMTWTKTGSDTSDAWSNKDSKNETLKMGKNGNYVEYVIELPKAVSNCEVALYGWVDYWKDGSNNNDAKGHIVDSKATFSVTVNGTAVSVTNNKTFEEMGMEDAHAVNDQNVAIGTYTLCPLGGTISLQAGKNTIKYKRETSYNLNISEIHFIGKEAA